MGFLTQVNWIAIIVGGIFNMSFGALWYGPLLGKTWLRVIGKKQEDIQSSATMYVLPMLAGLAGAYILAVIIRGLGINVWWQGGLTGIILYLGVGAAATLTMGIFEESPRGAWLLYTFYQIIVFGAQGILYVLWK